MQSKRHDVLTEEDDYQDGRSAEKGVRDTTTRKRTHLAFWLLGFFNNFTWVAMNAGAGSIVPGQYALIYIVNQVPGVLVKASAPYWFHRVSYGWRVIAWTSCMACCFPLVTFCAGIVPLQLLGIVLTSVASGGGEATFLALSQRHVDPERCLAMWSSGTGFAGPGGYLLNLLILSHLGSIGRAVVGEAAVVCYACAFALLLPPQQRRRRWRHSEEGQAQVEDDDNEEAEVNAEDNEEGGDVLPHETKKMTRRRVNDDDGKVVRNPLLVVASNERKAWATKNDVDGGGGEESDDGVLSGKATASSRKELAAGAREENVFGCSKSEEPKLFKGGRRRQPVFGAEEVEEEEEEKEEEEEEDGADVVGAMTFWERAVEVSKLWSYMVPLFVVYWAEYVLQSGTWTCFSLTDARNPSSVKNAGKRDKAYLWMNLMYQVGVFVSRSSKLLPAFSFNFRPFMHSAPFSSSSSSSSSFSTLPRENAEEGEEEEVKEEEGPQSCHAEPPCHSDRGVSVSVEEEGGVASAHHRQAAITAATPARDGVDELGAITPSFTASSSMMRPVSKASSTSSFKTAADESSSRSLAVLWAMPLAQCVLLALFTVEALTHALALGLALIAPAFVVGLLGGAVYVNAFVMINQHVAPSLREFALGAVAVADSTGVLLGDVAGLFWQWCLFEANGIADQADGSCPF